MVGTLSEIACSGDWRELWLLAVPCPGLPSGGLVQPLCCSLWDVSRSWHGGRGELCLWVPGGAGLAPGSLQLCWGLQCQCYDCFCTQIVWEALFIVLVLFKNAHNRDVIYKTDCLQDIFCILRCVYCKKKKDEKWCFSTTVSSDCMSVSLSTDRCSSGVSPPFLWSCQKHWEASESLYSLGKKVLCLKNGTCFPPIYFVNLYSDYHGNVSWGFFVHSLLVVNMFFLYIK